MNALFDAREVWQDRQALRRNGFLSALSRRHLERALGRFGMLTIIMLVGLASLHTPFTWPTTARGWILLIAFYAIPIYLQFDGIRDRQLRRLARKVKG